MFYFRVINNKNIGSLWAKTISVTKLKKMNFLFVSFRNRCNFAPHF